MARERAEALDVEPATTDHELRLGPVGVAHHEPVAPLQRFDRRAADPEPIPERGSVLRCQDDHRALVRLEAFPEEVRARCVRKALCLVEMDE